MPRRRSVTRPRRLLGTLVLVTLLTGCASSTPLISDRDRCTRFGGLWEADQCRQPGGGGGGM
jgi:hypothetical protein